MIQRRPRALTAARTSKRAWRWIYCLGAMSAAYASACSSSNDTPFGGSSPPDSGTGGSGSSGAGSGTSSPSDAGSGSSSGAVGNPGVSSGTGSGTIGSHPDASADAGAGADASHAATSDSGGIVAAGDGGTCPAPAGVTSQETTALQIINQTRAAMGSPCATMVSSLNTSATKHCVYYSSNAGNSTCVANPHAEVQSCSNFVAANFGAREMAAGYTCQPGINQSCAASEVMAFDDNPTAALAQWIGSIYHRSPVLDPRMRDFGYGNAPMCDTIDFGEGAGSTTPANVIVSYPYDGQTGVGRSFYGAQESPTPPVPPNGWPSAMPVHIFMLASSVTLTTDEFGIEGGAQLPHQVMTPQSANGFLANALVLYGNAPLAAQTKYRVHVAGTRNNQTFTGGASSAQFDVSFAFTTQ